MNTFNQSSDEEALDESAAEWLYEREVGLTPEKARAYSEWLAKDPRHGEAIRRVERTLQLLDELPQVSFSLPKVVPTAASGQKPSPKKRKLIAFPLLGWSSAVAAMVAIAFFVMARKEPVPLEAIEYAVDRSAQRTTVLSDGSIMDMNAGSEVSVQFSPGFRRIYLRHGQAHFQVAHDASRPFIVTAGNVTVRAVGTAFDVRLSDDAVNVVVAEGKVELGSSTEKKVDRSASSKPLLQAGEYTEILKTETNFAPTIRKADPATLRSFIAWQTPLGNFMDVPLREVIGRFNLRNQTQLILADAKLGERKIGGVIALDDVEAFVRLLEQDGDVSANRSSPGIIELRSAH